MRDQEGENEDVFIVLFMGLGKNKDARFSWLLGTHSFFLTMTHICCSFDGWFRLPPGTRLGTEWGGSRLPGTQWRGRHWIMSHSGCAPQTHTQKTHTLY